MPGRETVLARVRAALADAPGLVSVPRGYRSRGEAGEAEVESRFVACLRGYGATVVVSDDPARGAGEALRAQGAARVVVASDLPSALRPSDVELVEDDGLGAAELDVLDGALTTCAAACADTGTIALDGGPGQGRRAITLVPDLHVCIVRAEQIVETVPELVARLEPGAREGRPIVLVSGPSATSDIGLERVEGVHGPRRLVVVVATRAAPTLSRTGRGAAW
ncbi:LutC/YkgG family protein [Gaiella occulta]|uniref:LutC/YkgG family protein n=1 Tax=Gaiella occulta TaxID=1002870 RepID=UPI000E0BB366|nr:LUD domain-containing protein [Gaiella occulta]